MPQGVKLIIIVLLMNVTITERQLDKNGADVNLSDTYGTVSLHIVIVNYFHCLIY